MGTFRSRTAVLALAMAGALAFTAMHQPDTRTTPPNESTAAGAPPPQVVTVTPVVSLVLHRMSALDSVPLGAVIRDHVHVLSVASSDSITRSVTATAGHSATHRTLARSVTMHRAESFTFLHATPIDRLDAPRIAAVLASSPVINPPNISTARPIIGASAFPLYL